MGTLQGIMHIRHRFGATAGVRRRRAVGAGLAVALSAGVLTAAPAMAAAPYPDPPTAVSAVATGATGATVSWTAPAFDGGTPIVDYQISAKPGTVRVRTGSTATSGRIDGLTPGVTYTFTVRAINSANLMSDPSAESNQVVIGGGPAATAPGAPTDVTAVPGDGSATITWTPPADDGGSPVTGYRINSEPGATWELPPGDATSWTFPGLTNGVSYTFKIRAVNAVGSGAYSDWSNTVVPDGSIATVPGVPTGVKAVAGNGSATITWTAPASDGGSPITGYRINSSPGGTFETPPAGATSWTFPGLTNGVAYTFKIRAVNAVGSGNYSDWTAAVTPEFKGTVPGAPTGVTAVAAKGSAVVGWSAPANTGGSALTQYRVESVPATAAVSVDSSKTSMSFPGLQNGVDYRFTVKAVNTVGASVASAPSRLVRVGGVRDWNGDGKADLVARTSAGDLLLYSGKGAPDGGFTGAATRIGAGWGGFTMVLSGSDWNGDGKADLIARTAGGDLLLYRGNGVGGFVTGTPPRIGAGWQVFDRVLSPGDWNGDGKADLIARKTNGDLLLYRGNGLGGFVTGTPPRIGAGWHIFGTIVGVGL